MTIAIGAILVEGFAHPCFYEVVSLTASGKSAVVRKLWSTEYESSQQSGTTRPVTGRYMGGPVTCRITRLGQVKVPGYQAYATPWDGKPRDYYTHD